MGLGFEFLPEGSKLGAPRPALGFLKDRLWREGRMVVGAAHQGLPQVRGVLWGQAF